MTWRSDPSHSTLRIATRKRHWSSLIEKPKGAPKSPRSENRFSWLSTSMFLSLGKTPNAGVGWSAFTRFSIWFSFSVSKWISVLRWTRWGVFRVSLSPTLTVPKFCKTSLISFTTQSCSLFSFSSFLKTSGEWLKASKVVVPATAIVWKSVEDFCSIRISGVLPKRPLFFSQCPYKKPFSCCNPWINISSICRASPSLVFPLSIT